VKHRHNSLRNGPYSKLLPYRKGPMRKICTARFGHKNKDYHAKRFDPEVHDPMKFALKDETDMNKYLHSRQSKWS
jgi:hypothetical protein